MPDRMPAAVLKGPGRLEVEDVVVPAVGDGDVLVRVEHCGICGTDLHLVLEGWGKPGSVPGHEWTGTVAAVGSAVTGWAVGDAVVGGGPPRCGTCRHCAAGRPSLCESRSVDLDVVGAFARYTVVPAATLLARPPGMDSRTAALAEPLAVAVHAVERSGAGPGDAVLVSGAGPIGTLTVAALRAAGVDAIRCVEPSPRRQALAAALGAAVCVPADLDVPSVAEPDRVVADAVDVAIECSGKPLAMEAALGQLRRGGTLVLVGAGIEAPRFDPNRILLNELVVTGAYEYGADSFARALAMLASGAVAVDVVLEPDDVDLDGALDAMRALAAGERAGKVLVAP